TVSQAASTEPWEAVLPTIMHFYRANLPKMTVLLGPTGDPSFLPLLRSAMTPMFLSSMSIPTDDREAYYIVEFLITGVVTFMSSWHLREPGEPPVQTLEAIRTALMEGCCKELACRSDDPVRAERFLLGHPES
ncbi:MAG: TetR-like C-terminal domain-containing protein, partial [Coriobacteriales bacterium]